MESQKGIPFVRTETLEWFYHWCRDHGIAGDNSKLKSGIIAGVFAPAAVAVPDIRFGRADQDRYQFFIFPARLERWAEENAIEYR